MIHLLVVTLILMSIVGATGFGFLNMSHSVDMLYSTQSDKALLSKWVIAIENGRMENHLNGRALVPYGINTNQDFNGNGINDVPFHILPDGFGLPKTNAFGRYYIYCPIGDSMTGSTSDEVNTGRTEGDSDSYDVTLIDKDGVKYVSNSSLGLPDGIDASHVSAFILSPYKSSKSTPSCADVKQTDGRFHAKDAIVSVVSATFSESERISKSIILNEDSDLSLIAEQWKLGSELHYFIDIPPASLSVQSDIDFCFNKERYPRKIHLKGNFNDGSISQLNGNSKITINACNVDLYISDMSFSNIGIDGKNSSITLKDSNIGDLSVIDSDLNMTGTINVIGIDNKNIIKLSSSEWDIKDSVLKVRAAGTLESIVSLDASNVHMDSSKVTIAKASSAAMASSSAIDINESSRFASNKTIFNISAPSSNSAFVNKGKLDIIESTINISNNNKGILLKDGGTLGLNKNTVMHMSGSNTTAIADISSLGVYGSQAIVTAGTCWSGRIFESSNSAKSSKVSNALMITNRSDWTCN